MKRSFASARLHIKSLFCIWTLGVSCTLLYGNLSTLRSRVPSIVRTLTDRKDKRTFSNSEIDDGDSQVYRILTLADDAYARNLVAFVDNLLQLDVPRSEILVGCLSSSCLQTCEKKNILSMSFTSAMVPNVSHVQLSKTRMISGQLRSGHSVYFFDLDVVLYDKPGSMLRVSGLSAHYEIIAQTDGHGSVNYGLFFVRPADRTIDLFKFMEEGQLKHGTWDQELFNWYIKEHMQNETFVLPSSAYVNMMLGVDLADVKNIKAAHATCVEGPETKKFAINYLFGNPRQNTRIRTISASVSLDDLGDSEILSMFLKLLAVVAKRTDRVIRLRQDTDLPSKDNIYNVRSMFRVVSADRLGRYGVQIEDPRLWTRSGRRPTQKSAILTGADFLDVLDSLMADHETEEIELHMPTHNTESMENVLKRVVRHVGEDEMLSANFSCSEMGKVGSCLHICDGKHAMY